MRIWFVYDTILAGLPGSSRLEKILSAGFASVESLGVDFDF